MPLPGGVLTTADIGGGSPYTALNRGPLLVGTQTDSVSGGPRPPVSGVIPIQSTSTTASNFVSTGAVARAAFLYIPQTTGELAALATGPAYGGGAALSWDSATKTLEVYSTVTGAWMRLHSSTGANLVFSSS